MEIGVLALQGAVREHLASLRRCGVEGRIIKTRSDLNGLTGLIIPGGESTTVGKLLVKYDLLDPIKEKAAAGMGVFGTCTGMILLAREIADFPDQTRLGLMDVAVDRNAYGRQVDSFETDLDVPCLGPAPLHGVFIRAPKVIQTGPGVETLARWQGDIVLVRQDRLLAASFHPELTEDVRLHQYFLDLLAK